MLIRYPGAAPERVEEIARQPRTLGYDAAVPEQVPTSDIKTVLRFYHEQDSAPAARLARDVRQVLQRQSAEPELRLQNREDTGATMDPGTLEFGSIRADRRIVPCTSRLPPPCCPAKE